MAIASQAALLDELMGRNRNSGKGSSLPHFEDEDVCRSFLCGFCPNELFTNTRADLGVCCLNHDPLLRESYKNSKKYNKLGYEEEFYYTLVRHLSDVERRIRRGHSRLNMNSTMANPHGLGKEEREVKIVGLTLQIESAVNEAEKLGTSGDVEKAQEVIKKVEDLRVDRAFLQGDPGTAGQHQTKELEVCEMCGSFRIKNDAPQRVEEHLSGKMHLGYARIRAYVDEWEANHPRGYDRDESRPSQTASSSRPVILPWRPREKRPMELVGFKRANSYDRSSTSESSSGGQRHSSSRRHGSSRSRSRDHSRRHKQSRRHRHYDDSSDEENASTHPKRSSSKHRKRYNTPNAKSYRSSRHYVNSHHDDNIRKT